MIRVKSRSFIPARYWKFCYSPSNNTYFLFPSKAEGVPIAPSKLEARLGPLLRIGTERRGPAKKTVEVAFSLGAEKGEIVGENVGQSLGESLGLSTRGPPHAKLPFFRESPITNKREGRFHTHYKS